MLLLASVALDRNGTEGGPAGLLPGKRERECCEAVNAARPVGSHRHGSLILLWTFCIRGSDWGVNGPSRRQGILFSWRPGCGLYRRAGKLGEIRMEQRIGEEAALYRGYSISGGLSSPIRMGGGTRRTAIAWRATTPSRASAPGGPQKAAGRCGGANHQRRKSRCSI